MRYKTWEAQGRGGVITDAFCMQTRFSRSWFIFIEILASIKIQLTFRELQSDSVESDQTKGILPKVNMNVRVI